MAATIFYDSAGTYQSTINVEDGTAHISNRTFANAGTLTNEAFAIDQDITKAITSWGDLDALRFDFGSAVTVDYVLSIRQLQLQQILECLEVIMLPERQTMSQTLK